MTDVLQLWDIGYMAHINDEVLHSSTGIAALIPKLKKFARKKGSGLSKRRLEIAMPHVCRDIAKKDDADYKIKQEKQKLWVLMDNAILNSVYPVPASVGDNAVASCIDKAESEYGKLFTIKIKNSTRYVERLR